MFLNKNLKNQKMKTIVVILAVIFSFFLTSCGHQSGNLIGTFQVIKKVPQTERTIGLNPLNDCGDIYLVSAHNDTTIKILVFSNELYLNTKVGDKVLVGKHKSKSGGFYITKKVKRFEIGYCKITEKMNPDFNGFKMKVLSRGGDTITINQVAEIVYFNTSIGDSVFVKKNRGLNIYYTE